ncbi:MAG: PilN domain-containing protein [Krumholzibacteria bacterium]|nr:PilN domain-containing protein [Candidatus Krumholzibacteria bacterium]
MIRINLLPRDEQPAQRSIALPKVGAFAPLALVLVTAVTIGAAHFYQSQQISALQQIIAQEEEESRRLAPEIAKIKRLNQQRQDLNDRLDVITRLDADRYFRVHLLDEVNRSLPGYMWLTRFEDTGGDGYAIEGVTFSNFLVSDFLQNVADSPYFAGIDLIVTEKGVISDVQVVKFKARARAVRKAAVPDAFAG